MRILVLAALLGSGLCAQTPPAKPSEAAPSPDPAPLDRKRELLRRLIAPNDTGYVALPGIVPSNVFWHPKPSPAQTCSIPLLDVTPKGGFRGDPKIALPGSEASANLDLMPVSQGSPPCAPSKP